MVIAHPVVVTKFLATITKGKKNLFCFMLEEEEEHIVAGKAWQQKPKLGGHIVSTVRKQRQTEVHAQVASSFPLYIWSPTLFSVKGLWKLPPGHTSRAVSPR